MGSEPTAPRVGLRLLALLLGLAAVVAILTWFTVGYVAPRPATLVAASSSAGVTVHLETVAAVGAALENPRPTDPHPDWVGYLPTTVFQVPANTNVTMVIHQEDTPSGLRNPFFGTAQGIAGGKFHMKYYDDNGKPQEGDFSSIDPASAAHSFAIPELGVFVPLQGLNTAAPATGFNEITFTFHTGKAGVFHWQCFVPCGAKTLYGNGGPMQTFGYMAGVMIVT